MGIKILGADRFVVARLQGSFPGNRRTESLGSWGLIGQRRLEITL
jgi:hypothetical protein